MTLDDVRRYLGAEVICCGEKLDREVTSAFGCDLMSDVLAFARPGTLLLTGLTNSQVIHTAELIDAAGVVFVRGKHPSSETIRLSIEKGIPLLATRLLLYDSCGLLFSKGLRGCSTVDLPETPREATAI
ncbi:MAG TPA: hypothetical protein GX507_03650 [Clostridia bacterium]|nr:hypothetical protein [Clostridia bacterium]